MVGAMRKDKSMFQISFVMNPNMGTAHTPAMIRTPSGITRFARTAMLELGWEGYRQDFQQIQTEQGYTARAILSRITIWFVTEQENGTWRVSKAGYASCPLYRDQILYLLVQEGNVAKSDVRRIEYADEPQRDGDAIWG